MKNLSQNFPQEFQFQYIIQCCLRSVTVLLTHKMQLLQKFYYCFCCGCCQYYSHILFRNRKLVAEKKLLFLSLYLSPSHYSFFFLHNNYNSHLTLMNLVEFQLQSIFSFRNWNRAFMKRKKIHTLWKLMRLQVSESVQWVLSILDWDLIIIIWLDICIYGYKCLD